MNKGRKVDSIFRNQSGNMRSMSVPQCDIVLNFEKNAYFEGKWGKSLCDLFVLFSTIACESAVVSKQKN